MSERNPEAGAAPKPLRVAIIGAGIAGLGCYSALDKLSGCNLDINIYEQASSLHEVGASIALGPNGLLLLRKLGFEGLTREGWQNSDGTDHIWMQGKTGKHISNTVYPFVKDESLRTARFTRWHLHTRLKEAVPNNKIHPRKRLESVTVRPEAHERGRVHLQFADGTEETADFLIGADGVRSAVRKAFVPQHRLPFSGSITYRDIYDWDLVKDIPGLPESASHWLSKSGVTLFTSRLPDNKFAIACFVSGAAGDEAILTQNWDKLGDLNALQSHFHDWHPPLKQLMDRLPHVHQYPVFTGDSLETWIFDDCVAVIGDAAHPHGGSFAAGGSLAIEDSYALAISLNRFSAASKSSDISSGLSRSLKLFDLARSPHGKRVISAVAEKKYGWLAAGTVGDEQSPNVLNEQSGDIKYPMWLVEHSVDDEIKRSLSAIEATAR